ncbi:MAG: hypothetical protein IBX70_04775 [Clostridia bacterium]|nr:hypothetical protein [Clostridia bacterium]
MAEKKTVVTVTEDNEKEKKTKGMTGCLVILLILFLTPLLVVGGLYFFNRDFKLNANGLMSNVPGGIGEYFEKFPTKAEEMEQIRTISEYMLKLPSERAVDKLMVLSGEDSRAYDEVVKDMLRINPNATNNILNDIRSATVNKDALLNTVQRIEEEKQEDLKSKATYISSLPLNAAVEEVDKIIGDSINGHKDVANIFEFISDDKSVSILYQLDSTDRNKIFSFLTGPKAQSIKNSYSTLQRNKADLEQIAGVYSSENATSLVNTIGNLSNYSLDELAIIYGNIGAKKAGEVLAKATDESFIFDLISKIKANEILEKNRDTLTPDILKSLKIYKEFDDNVRELVGVYARMSNENIIPIIENMMINAAPSQVYDLDNGDLIMISDEDLIMEILKSFTEKKRSEIMSLLEKTLSTELTRKLALPKQ